MKKFFIILFISIFVLCGGLILSKWIANIVTDRFESEVNSEHFKISYNLTDKQAIPDVQRYLEENYDRVTTDLKQQLDEPVIVKIYSDLDSFHNAVRVHRSIFWWQGEVKNWVVGTANSGIIRIVSPLNPGNSGHTYDSILKVVVHEFVHVVASKINKIERGFVLSEGIAVYEARQMDLSSVSAELLPNSIEEMFSWDGNNNSSGMYSCGGSFVAFIVENYGYDKFIELYKRDYSNNVFDDDIREIYNKWISWVKNS